MDKDDERLHEYRELYYWSGLHRLCIRHEPSALDSCNDFRKWSRDGLIPHDKKICQKPDRKRGELMAYFTIEKNLPILVDRTAVNLNNVQYNVQGYKKDQETNQTIGITIQLTTDGMRILEENIRRASLNQDEADNLWEFISSDMQEYLKNNGWFRLLISLEREYEPEAFDYVYQQLRINRKTGY